MKSNKQKIYKKGLVWGAWDGLHVGHLNLLRRAKERCKELYVGVNADEYIEEIKGHQPIYSYKQRCEAIDLYAWQFVDATFTQNLSRITKQSAVDKLQPDVIFVGDDWKNKDWDGEKLGIPVIYLPRTKGISSSILREKLH